MVDAVVLLGWMKQETAVAFLRERCLFAKPPSLDEATDLWRRHRQRVEQLPARTTSPAPESALSIDEESAVRGFVAEQVRIGGPARSVVKVDPMRLRIRQLGVTLDRCSHFGESCRTRKQWIEQWLNPAPTSMEGRVRATTNFVNVELPHPEFVLGFDPVLGFQVVEAPRHVTVKHTPESTTLMAGHHRVYAYLSSDCASTDRSILAVAYPESAGEATPSPGVMEGAEDLCSQWPPTMADFLDARHAFIVRMRPRRFELQVRARMAVVPA